MFNNSSFSLSIIGRCPLRGDHLHIIGWVESHPSIFPALAPSLFVLVFELIKHLACKETTSLFIIIFRALPSHPTHLV